MNANSSRQSPAEWEESAHLLPQPARDLPTGRHQFHKERLMAHIQQEQHNVTAAATPATEVREATTTRRFRLPRPAIALPAMALALAGAVVAGAAVYNGGGSGSGTSGTGNVATGPALTTDIGTGTTKGVPQLLDQISLAAAEGGHPDVKPGQYIYIASKTADTYVKTVDDKSTLVSEKPYLRQTWMSADGTEGWLIDPTSERPDGEPLSGPDEQGNALEPGINHPTYDFLAGLTTDPDELLKLIYNETKGQGNSPDQQAFSTIGDLLGESYPPAELYAALFKAAAKIPGVIMVDDAVDAAGRHGVAVARVDSAGGSREEWIFDKKTHAFLGERVVQVKGASGDDGLIKPGTVTFVSAIVTRAIVDDMKQPPSQAG
ncbi:CU044_5270 family protein [Streptomyces sp. NRRL F-5135]|uniref:CU044_5270 family protein n=1 Tax=Streptomyces sp. NRRL F-5135 TaxID=1463858 RepID=UPI0004C64934|nr:CU044_5270 family protein [Streptomyces sp. NRRL F-5135]